MVVSIPKDTSGLILVQSVVTISRYFLCMMLTLPRWSSCPLTSCEISLWTFFMALAKKCKESMSVAIMRMSSVSVLS